MSGNTADSGPKIIMPMVTPPISSTSPRVFAMARQPSRKFASTCCSFAVASTTVGIFARARPRTATQAPAKSRNITEENPRVVYKKMPKAGAPMEATEASS